MKIATAILILCVLNFIAFAVGSMVIGGNADTRITSEEKYYVSNHGKRIEVTEQVWNYSYWHARTIIVTHPLAIILFLILGQKWQEQRKRSIQATTRTSACGFQQGHLWPACNR